jgi:3-oxoacyl-[acyl-carrier-protein] synthase II
MHPEARGATRAIVQAVNDAAVDPSDIGYVNAHGTSTVENDRAETRALHLALGPAAHEVPVSSTKSMTGHTVAAAGALELIACVLALRKQVLPPTINLTTPDPECDLDYVPLRARRASFHTALSNSFGFGGQNVALIVRRPEGAHA